VNDLGTVLLPSTYYTFNVPRCIFELRTNYNPYLPAPRTFYFVIEITRYLAQTAIKISNYVMATFVELKKILSMHDVTYHDIIKGFQVCSHSCSALN